MKKKKKEDIALRMLNSCFSCYSEEAKEVMVAFARYIRVFKLKEETNMLYLRILETNNDRVVDTLLNGRHPFLLFRHIKPTKQLIDYTFNILSGQDPISIYQPILIALLGILDMNYKDPATGNKIRRITTFDLNHTAKYLDESQNQYNEINRIILRILEYFYYSEYEQNPDSSVKTPGIHSMRIRLAFLDKKHTLRDIVPVQLLGPVFNEYPQIEKTDYLQAEKGTDEKALPKD